MDTLDHDLYQFLDEFTLGLLPPLRNDEDEVELWCVCCACVFIPLLSFSVLL